MMEINLLQIYHDVASRIARLERIDKIILASTFIIFCIIIYLYISRYNPRNSLKHILSEVDDLWKGYGKPYKTKCEPAKWREYCEKANKIYVKYRRPPVYTEKDMDNRDLYEWQLKVSEYLEQHHNT